MKHEITKIGKRGVVVIPAALRKQLHLEEGDFVIAENHGDGILLKPVVILPAEKYTAERKAEFLLSNAINLADYKKALKTVLEMGINPANIPHHKPKK